MAAVGKGPVSHADDVPGEPTKTTTSMLELGSSALQSFTPIKRIHAHLCAFHFYAYDMNRQVEAHHYCTHYNQDVRQCLIYDSPESNARLIGIEYIISEKLFGTLPAEEKKLWHTHEYEVKGGILFIPGIPKVAEHAELSDVATTYGKVFHFWQFDRGDTLPLGLPQLMMSFTGDGQLHPDLASGKGSSTPIWTLDINRGKIIETTLLATTSYVEKRFGVSFNENVESRKDIKGPSLGIDPLSNIWTTGKSFKPVLREVDIKDEL